MSEQPGRRRSALVMICVSVSVIYLDSTITPVAVPAIRADLHAGAAVGQWLLDAYTLALAVLLLSAGSIGDRLGRKRVLLTGIAGFGVCSLICAVAPTAPVLIAARAGQGIFAASVLPLSLAVTSALFDDTRQKANAIAVWGGSASTATALGPLVGGALTETVGWRSIFWINVPICAVGFVGLALTLPLRDNGNSGRLDFTGLLLFVLGTGALTFVLIEGGSYGWGSPAAVVLLSVGALALVAFGWWETRGPVPMLPPRLVRIPAVFVACTTNFLGMFGVYAVMYLLALYFQQGQHLSPLNAGLRFLPFTGVLCLLTFGARRVMDRWGASRTMIVGLLLVAAGLIGLSGVDYARGDPGYEWALVLLGLGVPLSSGVVAIQAMMREVPAELSGTASGTMNTFRHLGSAFGVALAGILSPERDGSVATTMYVTFVVAAVGALAAATIPIRVLCQRTVAHT